MCNHSLYCDTCEDVIMFKQRSEYYRLQCIELTSLNEQYEKKLNSMRAMRKDDASTLLASMEEVDKLRARLKRIKNEKRQVEEAQCLLKHVNREQRESNRLLMIRVKHLEEQVSQLSAQVEKLRALNHRLSITCAVSNQEISKLGIAYERVIGACIHLDKQTSAFSSVFKCAIEDKEIQKRLLEIVDELQATDLIQG